MASKTQQLFEDKENPISYSDLIRQYPWIIKKNLNCIVSPDSDGLLCGLFMSHYLGWRVRGFYDTKVLAVEKGINPRECVFLDVEIYRAGVRSMGQHMVMFSHDELPKNWSNFESCISANNLRGFDFKHRFSEKYPLATIHLLVAIISSRLKVSISNQATGILLYTDGTFKNLFNYPDNCLSWFKFLKIEPKTVLYPFLRGEQLIVPRLMENFSSIFAEFRALNRGKRGAEKIQLSRYKKKKLQLFEIEQHDSSFRILPSTQERIETVLMLMASLTGWGYKPTQWTFKNMEVRRFKKDKVKPSGKKYSEVMSKNPLSLAMTSGQALEFTLDPDKVF